MNRTLDPSHPFYIDKDLAGAQMRQQAIDLYNLYAYWNEQLGFHEHARKSLAAAIEQARDRAKCIRALEAKSKGYKSAIQDAYIRDYYDVEVLLGGEELVTVSSLIKQLGTVQENELEARNNVSTLQAAVDICRSALSWDKQEVSKGV